MCTMYILRIYTYTCVYRVPIVRIYKMIFIHDSGEQQVHREPPRRHRDRVRAGRRGPLHRQDREALLRLPLHAQGLRILLHETG